MPVWRSEECCRGVWPAMLKARRAAPSSSAGLRSSLRSGLLSIRRTAGARVRNDTQR